MNTLAAIGFYAVLGVVIWRAAINGIDDDLVAWFFIIIFILGLFGSAIG